MAKRRAIQSPGHGNAFYSRTQVSLSNTFPLRFHRVELAQGRTVPPHRHQFHEIGIVLSGELEHQSGQSKERLTPGAFYVLTPEEGHEIRVRKACEMENIYYLPELFGADFEPLLRIPRLAALFVHRALLRGSPSVCATLSPEGRRAAMDLLSAEKNAAAAGPGAQDFRRALFMALLPLLAQAHAQAAPEGESHGADGRILTAIAAIERRLTEGQDDVVPAVGAALGMTREYASTYFHEHAGLTIRDYVLRRRIMRSCAPLLSGSSAAEAARAAGFYDPPHYARSFKKIMGCSPSEYRARVLRGLSSP